MKTTPNDPEAECRKRLAPLADLLARTDPENRRSMVAQCLRTANRTIVRLLGELLIKRLGYKNPKVRDGAEETLALLGPWVVPALEWAALNKPSKGLLLRLAPLLAGLGKCLPEHERSSLQMSLFIAAHRAQTRDSRTAL